METPVSSIVSTGDLGGQKVAMGIDENAMAHIMSILTDLYSDPEGAVIREYSTNARDSHIEVGNPAPIEIITPSALSPYFKVIDHGVGLSVDDITDMYSKYGASTKRGTNDQVGMLGLGAKSALTLVPQFNLTSVKNGVKIWVSISRNASGAGQMEIIDTASTAEPNGVEISIPIPRNHSFAQKCRDFFRFWEKGTVLVDGKEPEHITGRPVGDNFIINSSLNDDYVVMGNVAYPVKDGLWKGGYSYNKLGIIAFVKIGDVNFTPSREQLHYTPKTRETIGRLQKEFADNLLASAIKDIDESANHAEAWKKAREWRSNFGGRLGTLTYKGVDIPSDISFASKQVTNNNNYTYNKDIEGKEFSLNSGRSGRYTSWVRSVNPTMLNDYMFVVGFAESLKMSPVQREKAAIYASDKGWSCTKAVIFNEKEFITNKSHLLFLEGIHIVPWEDIAKIKVQRNVSTNKVIRTDPYDLYDGSYGSKQVSTMDTSKQITYYSTAELNHPSWLSSMLPDAQIVILSKNRWDKFKRDFPSAKHWREAVLDIQKSLVVKLTDEDKILWHYSANRWTVKHLDPAHVEDPKLKKFITVLKFTGTPEWSDAAKKLRNMSREAPSVNVEVPDNPLTNYPLLGNINSIDVDHVYWYLNTHFNANLKEN